MKIKFSIAQILISTFMIFSSCIDQEETISNSEILKSVGFKGTLPDGKIIGTPNFITTNGVTATTGGGSFLTHSLSLFDRNSDINIIIELPYLKISETSIDLQNIDFQTLSKEKYPISKVKEVLALGNKKVLSSENPDLTKSFRVQVYDQNSFVGYLTDNYLEQSVGILRVTDLIEGEENDPQLGPVKYLEVIFELDVDLYKFNQENYTFSGKIAGLARMKFQEKK